MTRPELFAELLADAKLREIFEMIARHKKLRFKELERTLARLEVELAEAEEKLDELKLAGLIEERPGSIREFSTYYVTARGMRTQRQLRRAQQGEATSFSE